MRRARVHPEKAAAAVEAVREGTMSLGSTAETFAVSASSIQKRLNGEVSMDSNLGASIVFTREKEAVLVDTLL